MFFHIFDALAPIERSIIRERTNAGLKAALPRGRKGGRRLKVKPDDVQAALALLSNPGDRYAVRLPRSASASRASTATPQGRAAVSERRADADPPPSQVPPPNRLAATIRLDPLRSREGCLKPYGKTFRRLGDRKLENKDARVDDVERAGRFLDFQSKGV